MLRAQWARQKRKQDGASRPSSASCEQLLERVEALHEFNPMLGHRGCRLGITYPEITEMQARAHLRGGLRRAPRRAIQVIPEVMIPLVGPRRPSCATRRLLVRRVAEEVMNRRE